MTRIGALVDGRSLLVRLVACSHAWHRHKGVSGGWCRWCGVNWCTLKPYDCDLPHPPRHWEPPY